MQVYLQIAVLEIFPFSFTFLDSFSSLYLDKINTIIIKCSPKPSEMLQFFFY